MKQVQDRQVLVGARSSLPKVVILCILALLLQVFLLDRKRSTFFSHLRAPTQEATFPDLYEATIADLQRGLDSRLFSSVDLVKAYFARIDEVNLKGPALRAVIELNPSALDQAATLDQERYLTGRRSMLHGIPILLKDTLATRSEDGMNTTAGSYALLGSIASGDSTVAAKLRKAGAIVLGKTNLSQWSGLRNNGSSGWSSRGGQCTNPYYPEADPCGSSSGSAVASAIGLAAVTIGGETDGSITCPASYNNVVGIKPTLGLVSRNLAIPITEHQDTIGPLARTMTDAVTVLTAIAGRDRLDNYTLAQPKELPDFAAALNVDAFRGARLGVPRVVFTDDGKTKNHPIINEALRHALDIMRGLGATIIDPADMPSAEEIVETKCEENVARVDFKINLNQYLAGLQEVPTGVRTLTDLIAFNAAHPELEGVVDPTEFIKADSSEVNATYFDAIAKCHELGSTQGIDFVLKRYKLDALIMPANGWTRRPAAIVGYPIVTVPLGFHPEDTETQGHPVFPAPGIPFGISFVGTAFSEMLLIGFGYAFEQATMTRLQRLAYEAAIPKTQIENVVGPRIV